MSWIWGLYGTDFFQLMGLCNTHIAEMPYPFPKADSDGELADCLIENTTRAKSRQKCVWTPLRIALLSLGLLIGILEMIVFEAFVIHWMSQ